MNWESWLICTLNTTLYGAPGGALMWISTFLSNTSFTAAFVYRFLSLSLFCRLRCVCCIEAHFACAPNVNISQLNPWFFEKIYTSVSFRVFASSFVKPSEKLSPMCVRFTSIYVTMTSTCENESFLILNLWLAGNSPLIPNPITQHLWIYIYHAHTSNESLAKTFSEKKWRKKNHHIIHLPTKMWREKLITQIHLQRRSSNFAEILYCDQICLLERKIAVNLLWEIFIVQNVEK